MLVERIRRVALLFQLTVQFACQFSIFVCVARILIGIPVALWRRENCVRGSVRSNREWRRSDCLPLMDKSAAKSAAGFFFCFPSDTRVSFSSQENFFQR